MRPEAGKEAGQIDVPVLYGESDGVWISMQCEAQKKVEVRVAILSNRKKQISTNRYRLENKATMTAVGMSLEAWQEHVLQTAHQVYRLENTKLLMTSGDGNRWVRYTFNRLGIR
ncbi:MAG: UPF0236 family transposase-like protein [Anaerolineaceae bacterium]